MRVGVFDKMMEERLKMETRKGVGESVKGWEVGKDLIKASPEGSLSRVNRPCQVN